MKSKINLLLTFLLLLGFGSIAQAHQMLSDQVVLKPGITPEALAQKQHQAYCNRDLEGFIACFSEDVEVFIFPDALLYKGKEKLRKTYDEFFKSTPNLECSLVERTVNGNKVMEKLNISRQKKTKPMVSNIMYIVEDGLITKMYFLT